MEISIRQYEEGDKATLMKCLEDLQEHEAGTDPFGLVARREGFGPPYLAHVLKQVSEGDGVIYLAESDENVIGMIVCVVKHYEPHEMHARNSDKPYGYVAELYVAPEYRSKKIGASLMAKAEDYFRSKGCEYSTVNVLAPNARAYDFYKKNGYTDRYVSFLKKM